MKLFNDDCLKVLPTIPNNSIDLVVTSPPYNMRTRVNNGKYTTREKTNHFSKKYKNFDDALSIDDYYNFHKKIINEMLRISKLIFFNIQIVTGSKEALFKIIGDFNKNIKDIIIWDKGHGQPAMHIGVLNKATELIIMFESNAKAGRCFNTYNFNRGELSDIWRIPRERSITKKHSAIFPLSLAEKAIKNFSKENDIVLDPFMGSGTTGVACKNLKRDFIGIELDQEYFKIAKERIESTNPLLI
jgi:site-specific DNA-methyltransferase (adenine-specific)